MGLIYSICNLVALTAVLAVGVDFFYGIVVSNIEEVRPRQDFVSSPSGERASGKAPLESYGVITARNLFGSVDRTASVEEVVEEEFEDIEPTTLKIALVGTVAGFEGGSYAVIQGASGRNQGLFRVGDTVQSALVKRIRRGEVILQVGEKLEKLTMDEAAEAAAGGRRAEAAAGARGEMMIPVSRDMVERSLANINQLLTQVRVRPHFTDGQPDGLVVSHIRPNSIVAQLGLQNSDVVKGVDGREIKSPDDILSLYNSLKSGSDISVDVLRRGRLQTLRYSFN